MAILRICSFCKADLVFYEKAACWACPEVCGSSLVGLAEPKRAPEVEHEGQAAYGATRPFTELALHTTCLPGELFDEDIEVTPAVEYARAGGRDRAMWMPQSASAAVANGVLRPRNRNPESQKTYQCSDCGFRSPSPNHMSDHLYRERHEFGETPKGERVHRPLRQPADTPPMR